MGTNNRPREEIRLDRDLSETEVRHFLSLWYDAVEDARRSGEIKIVPLVEETPNPDANRQMDDP
jgi:hypothetical protein